MGNRGAGTRRTNRLKPESEHIVFEIPALSTKTEWDLIQTKTAFNKTKSKRGYSQSLYWLRDLLVCGECGGKVKPHHGVERKKDGSFPRYYCCYWSMQNTKTLKLANRKKCYLPYIRAETLESEVWHSLMQPYLFHSGSFKGGTWIPSKMGELVDSSRYDKKIKEMNKAIETLQTELKRLEMARDKDFILYEDDKFDKNQLARRLNRIKEETLTVQGKIKEARQRLGRIEEAKKHDNLYRQFLKNKKSVLRKLAADLWKLSPDDRKRLAEGTVTGKIELGIGYVEETQKEVAVISNFPETSPNMALLRLLMDEGKIGNLSKYSPDHLTRHEF